jgi:hypothetical protein
VANVGERPKDNENPVVSPVGVPLNSMIDRLDNFDGQR